MTIEESIERINEVILRMKESIEDLEEWKKFVDDFDNDMEGLGPIENLEFDYMVLGLQKMAGRNEVLFGRKPSFYTKVFSNKNKNNQE